jgi:hypothetical protein
MAKEPAYIKRFRASIQELIRVNPEAARYRQEMIEAFVEEETRGWKPNEAQLRAINASAALSADKAVQEVFVNAKSTDKLTRLRTKQSIASRLKARELSPRNAITSRKLPIRRTGRRV